MMQSSTLNEERVDDNKKGIQIDPSDTEDSDTDTNVETTHPAVRIVFRTENILEKICSHLEFKDLKQFRLVTRSCNDEGRRALIKQDRHWVVVISKNDTWQQELDSVLRKEERTFNQKFAGWMFKRLVLVDWRHSLGKLQFFQQWGHFLKKVHLEMDNYGFGDKELDTLSSTFCLVNTMHKLLSVYCPNLDEMVVLPLINHYDSPQVPVEELEDLEFPSPLLKLKYLKIKCRPFGLPFHDEQVLRNFFARLVTAAGTVLEKLEIDYGYIVQEDMERRMFENMALNVGESSFQSLKELTLNFAGSVGILFTTVRENFPELTKLIICEFNCNSLLLAMEDPQTYQVHPECFPALKSLTIHRILNEDIATWKILYFLQNFSNLEILNIYSEFDDDLTDVIPDPLAPRLESLRSFSFKTKYYDLCLLPCIVYGFPNIVTLNLLEFGTQVEDLMLQPEHSFGELMDAISPLRRLQQLHVKHAFHTPLKLVDDVRLASNLTALETLVLVQSAHDDTDQNYNVGLYLTTSDPDFLSIINWDCTWRLKSLQLVDFRFGATTTQEDVEAEAAAMGGYVSFGPICSGYVEPWICGDRVCLNKCQHL